MITVLIITVLTSCRMYSKFPKISILTSKGIEINDEIFFLMRYEVYRRPEGIAKFPDGGMPKDLVDEYYIAKYKKQYEDPNKNLSLIYKLNINKGSLIDLYLIKVFENNGKIFFPITYNVDKTVWKNALLEIESTKVEEFIIIDPKTDEITVESKDYKIDRNEDEQNIVSKKAIFDLLWYIYDYDKIGLPNPLEYIKLNDRNIKELFFNDLSNGRMHMAVLYYLIKNNKTELLDEIEKENTDKYIRGDIKYFKEGWTVDQLKEYYETIK